MSDSMRRKSVSTRGASKQREVLQVPSIDCVVVDSQDVNLLTGDTRKIFVSNIQDRRQVSLGAHLDRF